MRRLVGMFGIKGYDCRVRVCRCVCTCVCGCGGVEVFVWVWVCKRLGACMCRCGGYVDVWVCRCGYVRVMYACVRVFRSVGVSRYVGVCRRMCGRV